MHVQFRGWEPCGVHGFKYRKEDTQWVAEFATKNNWTPTHWKKMLSKDEIKNTTYSDFVGGYGQTYWTLQGLIRRVELGLAFISHNIDQFLYAKFLNCTFYLVPLPTTDWVMTVDTHFSAAEDDYKKRQMWTHPLKMMCTPHRIFCPSLKRKCNKLFYKRKIYPPANLDNLYRDKAQFANVQLINYAWSTVDLNNGIGDPDHTTLETTSKYPYKNTWFKCGCATWVDRTSWGSQFTAQDSKKSLWSNLLQLFYKPFSTWDKWFSGGDTNPGLQGPMCPVFYPTENFETMGFFYKANFLFSGHSIQAQEPGSAGIEIHAPRKCNGGGCPTDARCPCCTTPSDFSPGGTICPEKFRILTRSGESDNLDSSVSSEEEEEEETQTNIFERIFELFGQVQAEKRRRGL